MTADTRHKGGRLAVLPGRPRPLIFAHRGLSAEAPENSMAAFRLAKERGIPGVELDIHRCASGELVVFHDDSSSRTAPGSALTLRESSWSELKQLDIGSWKGSQWKDQKPILLAELFEEFGSSLYYDIEIKARTTAETGIEQALADLLKNFGLRADTITVSSFNPISLKRFKAAEPHIPTAIIYCHSKELPWYLRDGLGATISSCDYLKPEHVLVNPLQRFFAGSLAGRELIPWTVDDQTVASRMIATGCAGIISNQPDRMTFA
ncbi:MAG: glycerophosphodiester phosphodiesterase [Spirochaetes bacterium]|nr:glycerophosphodiester phosphodiesterase [Spirochaetota bacterium]